MNTDQRQGKSSAVEGSQTNISGRPLEFILDQLDGQIKKTERTEAELKRVNVVLAYVSSDSASIVFTFDETGMIQIFTPVAAKALGYSADEIVNQVNVDVFLTQDELVSRSAEYAEVLYRPVGAGFETLIAASHISDCKDQEWHMVRSDGSRFLASLNALSIEGGHTLVIATDVSEKKKPEMELRAALKKEKELSELKSRFVSMASHEFRTPLSAVLSSAYILSKYSRAEDQPQREKHINRIVTSVTSLTEILNDFLSVGKIEEGKVQPVYTEFDVKEQMNTVIGEVEHLLKKYQTISYVHDGAETNVSLDASMFKHIVINLLTNAIKFSTDECTIDVRTERNGSRLMIVVKDSGIGIPEEEQKNLFKLFFRSSYVSGIQGTGLGLHIVKKYVEFMGGTIAFKSEIGEGTEFTIRFDHLN